MEESRMKTVSTTDANRQFPRLLREVISGTSIMVLSRGKPVALLSPLEANEKERETARTKLMTRLRSQKPTGKTRDWTRDELYGPL
jgi:prevent-host-death family protein